MSEFCAAVDGHASDGTVQGYLLGAGHDAIGGHEMSLRAGSFFPPSADDTVSAAAWGFGLILLGVAVAVIMLGAVVPNFFGPGFNQSDLGVP